MRRIRIEPEPSRPALELIDLVFGLRGAEARAMLGKRSFVEFEGFDDAILYRIADDYRAKGVHVDYDPMLDAEAMAGGFELGPFVVRHREGEGDELVALIRELDPRLGAPDADDIIARHGLVQLAVSRAEATRTLERFAALGGRAEIEPLEKRWAVMPGEPETDF